MDKLCGKESGAFCQKFGTT